jgi:hypothetical protein
MTSSTGKMIAFGVFFVPLVALGAWVWETTPEGGARSRRKASGTDGPGGPGALAVSFSRPGPGEIRVTYANASSRRIAIAVPGRPGGLLRIVKPGVPPGAARQLKFDDKRDAVVEILPGGAYHQRYRTNAPRAVEVIYDARGTGLPPGTWRGIARSGTPSGEAGEGKRDTNGG